MSYLCFSFSSKFGLNNLQEKCIYFVELIVFCLVLVAQCDSLSQMVVTAGVCFAVCLYRRPDGQPDSRVSGQENRIERSEAVDALRVDLSALNPLFLRLDGSCSLRSFLTQ